MWWNNCGDIPVNVYCSGNFMCWPSRLCLHLFFFSTHRAYGSVNHEAERKDRIKKHDGELCTDAYANAINCSPAKPSRCGSAINWVAG